MTTLADRLDALTAPVEGENTAASASRTGSKTVNRAPAGWEPGVALDGARGTITTRPSTDRDPAWDQQLIDFGFDPAEFEIVEPFNVRTWDANIGNGVVRQFWYHKANIVRRRGAGDRVDVDELISEIKKRKRPLIVTTSAGKSVERAFVVALSDWQIGKKDGDGLRGTVDRILSLGDQVEDRIRELRKLGRAPDVLYVFGLGDLSEGCDGHYDMQAFSVEANRRDQIKIVRRLLRDLLVRWSKLAPRVVVSCVAGNHGENRRKGKAFTDFGDNDDVAVFEQVAEILASNQEAFGHVSFVIPRDRLTLALDVAGTTIGLAHGHQISTRKDAAWEWWKGQSLGRSDVGEASILLTGHFHHFAAKQAGGRTWFQAPTLDGGSQWFENLTGERTAAGTLTFSVDEHGWSDLQILGSAEQLEGATP